MPKPIVNNKIIYQNVYGRLSAISEFVNQGVTSGDSPTFANLQITGDTTIEGNLYVEGNTSILDTNVVEIEDNIILINRLETANGVTLNQAGIEVERGTAENYRFVFNESDDSFRIGVISNTQAVATREDNPLSNGIMIWNDSSKRLDATNTIENNITFNSTTNSVSSTTGSLMLNGGFGIKKDIFMEGTLFLRGDSHSNKSSIYTTTNNLYITSPADTYLTATKIHIPVNSSLNFGTTGQNISADNFNNLILTSDNDINLNLSFGKRIKVPNQIPITFSTLNEKIYSDDSNNMVITGAQDIKLIPGTNKYVSLPINSYLSFSNTSQKLYANIANDLFIESGNNIYIRPDVNQNIILPVDTGIKFGSAGLQRISGNNSNQLIIEAQDNLEIKSNSKIIFIENKPIQFGSNNSNYILGTGGNIYFNAGTSITIEATSNSSNVNSGALIVNGGVAVQKDLHVGGDLVVNGTTVTLNTETITVEDNLIIVNSAPQSLADGGILIKRYSDGISDTTGNIFAGIFYKESTDEFTFGYTSVNSNIIVNVTEYIPLRAKELYLTSSQDVTSFSSSSLATLGGAYIHKSLIVGEMITVGSINSSNIVSTSITSNNILITSTTNSSNVSNGAIVLAGGIGINKDLQINGKIYSNNTTPSTFSDGGVLISSGLTILNSNNSTNNSSGGALSVVGGAAIGGDLYVSGELLTNELQLNNLTLTGTAVSNNYSTGTVVSFGGITINNTNNSSSVTNGGSFLSSGGGSFAKDIYVGGKLESSIVKANDELEFSSNGFVQTITNINGTSLWNYFGKLNDDSTSYCDINFVYGANETNSATPKLFGLHLTCSINGTNNSFSYEETGNVLEISDSNKLACYIYKDNLNKFHLFVKLPPNSSSNVFCNYNSDIKFIPTNEGTGSFPNGSSSGYNNLTWSLSFNTLENTSNFNYKIGNLISQGDTVKFADNFPIIGLNTTSTQSRNLGSLYQRYQLSNDTNTGDVISDTYTFQDTLPNQSSANSTQIKFSDSANSNDNFYNGWWIKVDSGSNSNQIRQIINYNGSQRVAEIDSAWTFSNPSENDTVSLYNNHYVATYFDETDDTFKFGYTTFDNENNIITKHRDLSLQASGIYLTNTKPSENSTSGSLKLLGGISINNTQNSSSSTSGGTFTTLGGMGVRKSLIVGDNIGIGTVELNPNNSLLIKQSTSSIKLENDSNNISFIEFTEDLSDNKYSIISDSLNNQFSLAWTTTNQTPNNSSKALTVNDFGFVGINTTSNINSPFTLNANNFISTNDNSGYLGLISGSSNTDDSSVASRILLYGNSHVSNAGSLKLYTGTIGSIIFNTNDTNRVIINNNGSIDITTTIPASNLTTGSMKLSGGIIINNTENSTSLTSGGGMIIAGGASIGKDTYIGGDVYITGKINSVGSVLTPSISFSNTTNCSITTISNQKLIILSDQAILSFSVSVIPTVQSANCQFDFSVPNRTNPFSNRVELNCAVNGYVDDDDVVPLFNTFGAAQKNTSRGFIKFQSNSTGIHYISVICRYTID
jgi:hypothetical protein